MLRIVTGALLSCVCITGCGDDGGSSADAAPPDAPPPPDAPLPPLRRSYVLDRITLPADGTADLALDIDGNGTRENRLGSVLATLHAQSGGRDDAILFLRQMDLDRAIDRGDVITLLDLVSPTFREGEIVAATVVDGADPVPAPCSDGKDPDCRRHLAGDGRFAIADGASPGELAGAVIAGDIAASGSVALRLPFASGAADLPFISARLEVHETSTGMAGLLGGGIRQRDIRGVLVPAMAAGCRATVAAECAQVPNEAGADDCGCVAGTGRTLLGLFDADEDCALTDDELAASDFIRTVFAPDLDLEPPAMQNDALSFAVAIGAVPATWSAAP